MARLSRGSPRLEVYPVRPLLQGIDGRFSDMPGCRKVRLADPKRNDILHTLDDLKEVANS